MRTTTTHPVRLRRPPLPRGDYGEDRKGIEVFKIENDHGRVVPSSEGIKGWVINDTTLICSTIILGVVGVRKTNIKGVLVEIENRIL